MSVLITEATGFLGKALVEKLPLKEYDVILAKLDNACSHLEHHLILELLLSIPAGFNPTDGIEF